MKADQATQGQTDNATSDDAQKMWAIFVPGPDELWAMPSKEAAEAAAERHNKAMAQANLAQLCDMPDAAVAASVVEWPYDARSHASGLKNQESTILSSSKIGVPDNLADAMAKDAAVEVEKAQFNIDARALPALALFTDELAATANRVMVMPHPDGDGVLLVATDRINMAIWHDKEGRVNGKILISVPNANTRKMIVRACAEQHTPRIRYSYLDERYEVDMGHYHGKVLSYKCLAPCEATGYPDPFKAIPKEQDLLNGLHGRITLDSLRKISKAAKLARRTASPHPRYDELTFWSKGDSGHGVIVARCQIVPNLLMLTSTVAAEVDGQRKPYVSGFNTIFPE